MPRGVDAVPIVAQSDVGYRRRRPTLVGAAAAVAEFSHGGAQFIGDASSRQF